MAGVHRSCVEAWIASHRRTVGPQRPRCPVCRAEYGGSELHPGTKALVQELAKVLWRQIVFIFCEAFRFVLLGSFLVQYTAVVGTIPLAARGAFGMLLARVIDPEVSVKEHHVVHRGVQLVVHVFAVAIFTSFLLQKLAVLSCSLPPHRMPPASSLMRRLFYTTDLWCIAQNVAELLATALLLAWRCFSGDLQWRYFMPVALVVIVPTAQLMLWYPFGSCFKESLLFLGFLCCAPLLALIGAARLIWRHRRRLFNPLDGSMHVGAAFIAMLVCLLAQSRRPAIVFFASHSTILILGLIERATLRNLPWRDGRSWWCAILVALEVASISLDRRWFTLLLLLVALRSLQRAALQPRAQAFLQDSLWWCSLLVASEATSIALREMRGAPKHTMIAEAIACVWLGLICGLACAVNWRHCVRHYRGWQLQHATFVLCTPPHETTSPSEIAASNSGLAPEP